MKKTCLILLSLVWVLSPMTTWAAKKTTTTTSIIPTTTSSVASSTTPTPFAPGAHSMAEYTCYPIFTANTVKPNILILLDNSGNMNMMAYGYDEEGYYYPNDYDPNITYYG